MALRYSTPGRLARFRFWGAAAWLEFDRRVPINPFLHFPPLIYLPDFLFLPYPLTLALIPSLSRTPDYRPSIIFVSSKFAREFYSSFSTRHCPLQTDIPEKQITFYYFRWTETSLYAVMAACLPCNVLRILLSYIRGRDLKSRCFIIVFATRRAMLKGGG